MNYRPFGRTGWQVSEIGFGAWAIGAEWGEVSEEDALGAILASIDHGVNFIDTADVYGDGRSEQLVSRAIKARPQQVYVATKMGRRLDPHVPEGFNAKNMTAFLERSLKNLDVEAVDLVQLHCPPTQVYYMPEVFGILAAVEELRSLVPEGTSLAQMALRWILMFDAVSLAIPGAKNPQQAVANAAASDLPPLGETTMWRIEEIYNRLIRDQVHRRW